MTSWAFAKWTQSNIFNTLGLSWVCCYCFPNLFQRFYQSEREKTEHSNPVNMRMNTYMIYRHHFNDIRKLLVYSFQIFYDWNLFRCWFSEKSVIHKDIHCFKYSSIKNYAYLKKEGII